MTEKATGFASPAQGYEEKTIDLNRLLIRNPPATYFVRLESADMETLGLPRGSVTDTAQNI
jgi:DNA polymerase V